MEVSADAIAGAVQRQFAKLPQKRKPLSRGNGIQEWVPLSGIVAQERDSLRCVALGTGMKCLPQSKIQEAQGVVLHDWHAEIVAIRAFNRFLLEECRALCHSSHQTSAYVRRMEAKELVSSHFQPFAVQEDVFFHMYCSEAPCGDASMELTMATQDDDTPWAVPADNPEILENLPRDADQHLHGRGYFSELGVVRRKPSRPDAPPTMSKSCSDKLTLHQCTSLLSSTTSLLISPENAYISTLTVPESQCSRSGCERAFSDTGRMGPLRNRKWTGDYRFQPFDVLTTKAEFEFSRRRALAPQEQLAPSNLAAAWTPYMEETLIGGVQQGRKQFDPRGASLICKKGMWKLASDVAAAVEVPAVRDILSVGTYDAVKESDLLRDRNHVKSEVRHEVLRGWIRNIGNDFVLDDGYPRP